MDTACESEEAPLLQSASSDTDSSPDPPTTTRADWRSVSWLIVLLICIQITASVVKAPYVRLLESAICNNHYLEKDPSVIEQNRTIPEHFCKIPPIQQQVSLVQTLQQFFSFITGTLASLHIPLMLESRGRKTILNLNLFLQFCALLFQCLVLRSDSIAVEWTWVSSLLLLGAGGPEWRGEIIFMLIANATYRGEDVQDTYFAIGSQQAVNGITAFLVMRPVAELMASSDVWALLVTGLGMIPMIILFVLIIPTKDTSMIRVQPIGPSWSHTASTRFAGVFRIFKLAPRSVCLLLSTYLASSTFPQMVDNSLFEQYISMRFKKTIAEASKLQADSMGMNVVALLVSMILLKILNSPYFGHDRRSPAKYIYLGFGTAMVQSLGFTTIGISATYPGVLTGLVFCALGQPLRIAIRCALLSMAGEDAIIDNITDTTADTITGLFSTITLLDMASSTIVNFVLTLLFGKSLQLQGIWFGLPFFFAAVLLGAVAALLYYAAIFRQPPQQTHDTSTIDRESSTTPSSQPGTYLQVPGSQANNISSH